MGQVGGWARGVELTGSEASDVGNFRVCVSCLLRQMSGGDLMSRMRTIISRVRAWNIKRLAKKNFKRKGGRGGIWLA